MKKCTDYDIDTLGIIWAQDHNRVLATGGKIPWHVPADLKHFKHATLGCPVIMGRVSFAALGTPLPGRRNIILTRHPSTVADFVGRHKIETATSLQAVLELCAGVECVWITGGGMVYREVMDAGIADLLVVSEIDLEVQIPVEARVTLAPRIDPAFWQLDQVLSDTDWRPVSGDARWRVKYYIPR